MHARPACNRGRQAGAHVGRWPERGTQVHLAGSSAACGLIWPGLIVLLCCRVVCGQASLSEEMRVEVAAAGAIRYLLPLLEAKVSERERAGAHTPLRPAQTLAARRLSREDVSRITPSAACLVTCRDGVPAHRCTHKLRCTVRCGVRCCRRRPRAGTRARRWSTSA